MSPQEPADERAPEPTVEDDTDNASVAESVDLLEQARDSEMTGEDDPIEEPV